MFYFSHRLLTIMIVCRSPACSLLYASCSYGFTGVVIVAYILWREYFPLIWWALMYPISPWRIRCWLKWLFLPEFIFLCVSLLLLGWCWGVSGYILEICMKIQDDVGLFLRILWSLGSFTISLWSFFTVEGFKVSTLPIFWIFCGLSVLFCEEYGSKFDSLEVTLCRLYLGP